MVSEFFQVELLIHEQHKSVTSTSSGTNQAFVCGILTNPEFECLDIASSTTLSGVWSEVYTNTSTAPLNANPFVDANFMVDVIQAGDLNANLTNRFGMSNSCDGKVVGDGVINGFDLYVLGAAQFRLGPYEDIGSDLSSVSTTQGRPETRFRCGESYTRLDWQNRISWETCFSPEDEERYILSTGTGRRLLSDGSSFQDHSTSKTVSGLVLTKDLPPSQLDAIQTRNGDGDVLHIVDQLDAKMYLWSNASPLGRWYIIHIPKIVLAIEFFVRGAEFASATQLNNRPAPYFNSSEIPIESNLFDLRFVRHRERSGMGNDGCAIVEAAGSQLSALDSGTISVSQRMIHGDSKSKLCAFDLMLWVPATATVHRPLSCEVQLAHGSVAMDGVGGSVVQSDVCASDALYTLRLFQPPPPPPLPPPVPSPPPPPSPPPTTEGGLSIGAVVGIVTGSAFSAAVLLGTVFFGIACCCGMIPGGRTRLAPDAKTAPAGPNAPVASKYTAYTSVSMDSWTISLADAPK